MKIRVHYPLGANRLALRTEADWERDIAPVRIDAARSHCNFEIENGGSSIYLKPVLRDGDALRWAQGENSLAIGNGSRALDLYPHFDTDSSCHVCDLHHVPSSFEERGYEVRVFLPPGYDENALQSFPVLYLQDGQNLFFPAEAFGGAHWRIGETLGLLDRMSLIRQVVAVGIYPRDREREYTAPGYAAYGRFLVEELKPWVDARYRTLRGPEHTAVLGSSLGGVASLALALDHPDVFGHAGCMSSTFGWRDDLHARVTAGPRRPVRIYLDSGWPQDNYERTRSMAAALSERGWRAGRDLLYLAFPGARHDESSWALRVHVPFQFFFGGAPPTRRDRRA